jgi:hypothetical protein
VVAAVEAPLQAAAVVPLLLVPVVAVQAAPPRVLVADPLLHQALVAVPLLLARVVAAPAARVEPPPRSSEIFV